MTADAKVGLLLGLVFIFIIAFIINGLPSFSKDTSNNELTTNMVNVRNNGFGIGSEQRKVSRQVIAPPAPAKQSFPKVEATQALDRDVRFAVKLPKISPAAGEIAVSSSFVATKALSITQEKQNRKIKPTKPALPKVYVVCQSDNLAVIAQKFYGSEQGNRKVNIEKIFKANRKSLSSPDMIYVGQKLVIPPLTASAPDKSIGKRHFTAGSRPAQGKQYAVRQGDSLWQIAEEQLGDGSRYSEIAALNAGVLDDEDDIVVGMRLKLPAY